MRSLIKSVGALSLTGSRKSNGAEDLQIFLTKIHTHRNFLGFFYGVSFSFDELKNYERDSSLKQMLPLSVDYTTSKPLP